MTIQGAINELFDLMHADDIPIYYKGSIQKVIETIVMEFEDRKTENSSEKPNNCEHITEDGVTCAKYPACDDCLDNPLNKVKGSERLLKGKSEPQTHTDEDGRVWEYRNGNWWQLGKSEPQNKCKTCRLYYQKDTRPLCRECDEHSWYDPIEDEPQTERSE